jgi:hypothetical protein
MVEATLGRTGSNVKHCGWVPLDVHNFFWRKLDITALKKKTRQRLSFLREEVVG